MPTPAPAPRPTPVTEEAARPPGLAELGRLLETVEPAARLVPPRVLRRIIKQDRNLAGLGLAVPHRFSYVISREGLLQIVTPDELDLGRGVELPATVTLLAAPAAEALAATSRSAMLLRYWRLLFHVRVHLAVEGRLGQASAAAAGLCDRVARIGDTEFEEIRSVLRQEKLLLAEDDRTVYVEFAAVYLELRFFASSLVGTYFPAVIRWDQVDEVLAADVDAAALFAATRLPGAPDPVPEEPPVEEEGEVPLPPEEPATGKPPAYRLFKLLNRRAKKAAEQGNVVRAALARMQAAAVGPPRKRAETRAAARAELDRLADRLRAALGGETSGGPVLRKALAPLLPPASRGVWPVEARLLYDLQKVCLDHERELFAVDLLEWALSLGRQPLRRPVPWQREVLALKHLRSAAGRLSGAHLRDSNRHRLARLLRDALHVRESRLRARAAPVIRAALEAVGMRPANLPEEVALNKTVQELLDRTIERGFLTMGDLRDALSRNEFKMPDVGGPGTFFAGDRLIRANRRLARDLDGVYRRGEIYLRWLQRLSSLAFGTRVGRFLTRYVILPFGGAFVVLAGAQFLTDEVVHLAGKLFGTSAHAVAATDAPTETPESDFDDFPFDDDFGDFPVVGPPPGHHPVVRFLTPGSLLGLGVFLLALLHLPAFRTLVLQALWLVYRGLRGLLVDLPALVLGLPLVRRFLASRWVRWVGRYGLKPLLVAGPLWGALWLAGVTAERRLIITAVAFVGTSLALNTRLGRAVEEHVVDWLLSVWQRLRVDFLPGLYRLVMDLFKRILGAVDRLLYRVDEWLRFRKGESRLSLASKAVLGVGWFLVTYVVRIYVSLLIEPTVNPIKHFPVVTVAAKLMLPLYPVLEPALAAPLAPLGNVSAKAVAYLSLVFLPGLAGFLVWELKENWRLYEANRPRELRPAVIGHHGEIMLRLLRPGLHSGTIPKLFARLRRTHPLPDGRGSSPFPDGRGSTWGWRAVRRQREALHHVEEGVGHFVDRELVFLLNRSRRWGAPALHLGGVALATNRVRIALSCPGLGPVALEVAFEQHAGWLVAGVIEPGWLPHLAGGQRRALTVALAGLYKRAGVDLVREQIAASLGPGAVPYHITAAGLRVERGVWETVIDLRNGQAMPLGRQPDISAGSLLFKNVPITWDQWVRWWEDAKDDAPLSGGGQALDLLPSYRSA